MVLEATSLLRMVLQKLDSVLLERNLKSCARKKEVVSDAAETSAKRRCSTTYSHEKMLIKILALRVLLGLLLDSATLVQINAHFSLLLIFVLNNKSQKSVPDTPK